MMSNQIIELSFISELRFKTFQLKTGGVALKCIDNFKHRSKQ